MPLRKSAVPAAREAYGWTLMVSPAEAASARTGAEIDCADPTNPTSNDVADLLKTYACSRMYAPIPTIVSTVVIPNTRVRIRVRNSRIAMTRISV